MGGCCSSGNRDEPLDQKEDKLNAEETKKEEGDAVAERAGRGPIEEREEPQESSDDIEFKRKVTDIKSSNDVTNVRADLSTVLEYG